VPELPEVETVVRDLQPLLVGREIASVRVGKRRLRRAWSGNWGRQLVGRRIVDVRRRGKWIRVSLEGDLALVVHLGMTGQLTVNPASAVLADHTHVVIGLDDGQSQLRFRDIRRFGSVQLLAGHHQVEHFFTKVRLGPEPFDVERTYWRERVRATGRCLKAALLDQRLIAGVGNIYADESLFEARLPPTQHGRDTTPAEADRLRRAIVKVLRRAIDCRGSSIRNYIGGSGLKGEYQEEFRVYGQAGKPCPRCRTPIQSMRLAGRATHYCPRCQGGVSGEW
jgi:formamidopyrimidine-DNA glycosylase